jgi:hypothetical protein
MGYFGNDIGSEMLSIPDEAEVAMKANVVFFVAILAAVLCVSATSDAYSGGDGSPDNPYQIAGKADLLALGADTDNYGQCFVLTADVNLTGQIFTTGLIGTPDAPFTGTFNGNGHKISNLYIQGAQSSYVGLFGYLGSSGQILNLGVVNANVDGAECVGALSGENDHGSIQFCYATGSVAGTDYVGGLVGESDYGSIIACYSKASVSTTGEFVGGLVGVCNSWGVPGTLAYCYATGSVSGPGPDAGGFAGFADPGTCLCCFWDIQTSGQTGSSGGKGLSTSQMKTMSIYQNAGWAARSWYINNGIDYPRLWWENMGGVAIPSAAAIPLAGSGTSADPYRVTTAQEFAWLSWYPGVLDKHIRLMADLNLSGTTLYPIGDLGTFAGLFDGNGHTLSNIVISKPGGEYAGVFSYVGTGGQVSNLGTINATISGYRFVGGIAGYARDAAIHSCSAMGSVSGTERVGGLVGYSMYTDETSCHTANSVSGYNIVGGLNGEAYGGSITGCYAAGSVSGTDEVGGLAGHNTSTITSSFATGEVTAAGSEAGGLVAFNSGDIERCYATGPVNGNSLVGGLIGVNDSSIFYCYSAGSVSGNSGAGGLVGFGSGTSDNCFWDTQTSGQEISSSGAIGKTTAQMRTLSTFTLAGWDFSASDGDPADWVLLRPGQDYPQLAWQPVTGDIAGLYGVDFVDYAALLAHWNQTGCPTGCGGADINSDGTVNMADLRLLVDNWLAGK